MSVRFCVLGSGSQGNASLLMTPDVHLLIDAGFPPEDLAVRMDGTGSSWDDLDAILLTHTHGDHIRKKCLKYCLNHNVLFVCHQSHADEFADGRWFEELRERNLLRCYDGDEPIHIHESLRVHPLELPHDADTTYGFRIEARCPHVTTPVAGTPAPEPASTEATAASHVADLCANYPAQANGERWVKLAYLADFGECDEHIAQAVRDVDLLALEFNHDVVLERRSGRHPILINRVLSRHGHLSNAQAADVFRKILELNGNGGPQLLLQLHLSRDCNRPELAYQAAQEVLLTTGAQTRIFSTRQDRRGTIHEIG